MTDQYFEIDQDACSGHGRCYGLAPEIFEPDDAGYGVVIKPDATGVPEPRCAEIIAVCPEQAISLKLREVAQS